MSGDVDRHPQVSAGSEQPHTVAPRGRVDALPQLHKRRCPGPLRGATGVRLMASRRVAPCTTVRFRHARQCGECALGSPGASRCNALTRRRPRLDEGKSPCGAAWQPFRGVDIDVRTRASALDGRARDAAASPSSPHQPSQTRGIQRGCPFFVAQNRAECST